MRTCPECMNVVAPQANFCDNCGSSLPAEPPAPETSALAPPAHMEWITPSPSAVDGEEVTASSEGAGQAHEPQHVVDARFVGAGAADAAGTPSRHRSRTQVFSIITGILLVAVLASAVFAFVSRDGGSTLAGDGTGTGSVSTGGTTGATGPVTTDPDDPEYPTAVRYGFTQSCISSLAWTEIQCRCLLEGIEDLYTLPEFLKVQQNMADGDVPAGVQRVLERCQYA